MSPGRTPGRGGLFAAVVLLAGFAAGPVPAQVNRDVVRIVSPFAAGGGREVLARTFINEFSAALGETVIIDNRPGAGGVTGTVFAAHAPAEGRVLLMTATNHNIAPLIESPAPYDPNEFAGVAPIGTGSNVLAVNAQTPFRSVDALIRYAKANPGKLNFSSAGVGASSHLAMAYFLGAAGIELIHVPYKSTNAAAMEMVAGRVQATFITAAEVQPFLKDPRVRILGVASARGSPFLPGVPSIAQSVPGFSYESWWGLLVPAATPRGMVERLNAAMRKALSTPAVVERIHRLSIEPRTLSPAEFDAFLRADVDTARRMVKAAGLDNLRQ